MRWKLFLLGALISCSPGVAAQAPPPSAVVVFWEEGFPVADTAPPSREGFAALLPDATFASTQQLGEALTRTETRLLLLPFGSGFPEEEWATIHSFLERGGNLLVLGGQPFTRAAYREEKGWRLRPRRLAFAKKLFINDYQTTPGARDLEFRTNEEVPLSVPRFDWVRAFSLAIRLSDEDLYPRLGSAGGIDARLAALAWGTKGGRRLSAPVVQIDHLKNNYVGGRWILVACELPADFLTSSAGRALIPALVRQALGGAEAFVVRPSWPLFLPGEPPTFQLHWQCFSPCPARARLELEVAAENAAPRRQNFEFAVSQFPYTKNITLSADSSKGLHAVTARLYAGEQLRSMYHTGFWIRDEAFLRSGSRVTVNQDFFEVDGQPQMIVGTTYMASDVQREFFLSPNPYVWDRDMAEFRAAGFNMLRTGWWTAWDQVMKESGVVQEAALRTLEAYLMTARKHRLPVQFTFFAFMPEVFGGRNPYLDPEALRRQKELILAVVERFKDLPYLMWDLINEPSFSNPQRLFETRPNRDEHELRAWNAWLKERYRDRGAIAEAWKMTPTPDQVLLPLPTEEEFSPRVASQTMRGSNALKVQDYHLFAQEQILHWAEDMRKTIRATGSQQLITIGQDEGGGGDRPSPAFFGGAVDFTTAHNWWLLDSLLWDSLVAKQPGKAMLTQELGVGHVLQIEESERRTPEELVALFERKVAMALGTSTGVIQWLWHINAYMREDNEVVIGAIRPDGTEKSEAEVLRNFAKFAAASGGLFVRPEPAEVAIVTSQAFQYSALNSLAVEAQMKAVRALHYYCRVPGYVVAENELPKMGNPRLVSLPSPHALSEEGWQALLKYVKNGGTLLVTGSMERDPHWAVTHRLSALGFDAAPQPLTYRQAELNLEGRPLALSFDGEKQRYIETLRFSDGKTFRELTWGKGRILFCSYPVELAEGLEASAALYGWALRSVGMKAPFEGKLPSPGVLIRPVFFRESVLYLIVSESGQDEDIAIKDNRTGADIRFRLPSGRARLVLVDKRTAQVISQYGF
jgi:hypothetical protein